VRTLVTGGAGFIGSALVERLLAEGHTVDVVDNLSSGSLWNLADARASAGRDLTFHQLDVRSPDVAELVARRRPEVVWHLAAQTDVAAGVAGPAADAQVNIVGSLALLEGVRAGGARKLIVTSSAAVYGDGRGDTPTPESSTRRPVSPHGIAKHAVDSYLAAYAELESIVFTSLVLATVYGPRAVTGAVADWAGCLVGGRACTLFGDGSQVRDFVYVDDVVDALARAADHADGMVLNIGTGRGTTLAGLHVAMVEAAGRLVVEAAAMGGGVQPSEPPEAPGPPEASESPEPSGPPEASGDVVRRGPPLGLRHVPARPGDVRSIVLDPSRAAKALEWAPWTDLPTGIEAVLRAALIRRE
jgi:UDP-glucose 4-epimerase